MHQGQQVTQGEPNHAQQWTGKSLQERHRERPPHIVCNPQKCVEWSRGLGSHTLTAFFPPATSLTWVPPLTVVRLLQLVIGDLFLFFFYSFRLFFLDYRRVLTICLC